MSKHRNFYPASTVAATNENSKIEGRNSYHCLLRIKR